MRKQGSTDFNRASQLLVIKCIYLFCISLIMLCKPVRNLRFPWRASVLFMVLFTSSSLWTDDIFKPIQHTRIFDIHISSEKHDVGAVKLLGQKTTECISYCIIYLLFFFPTKWVWSWKSLYTAISSPCIMQCSYTEIRNCRSQPSKNILTTSKSTDK